MPTYDSDTLLTVLGVPGRLTHRTTKPGQPAHLWTRQRWISTGRPIDGYGQPATIRAELRFDDDCGNGHNTFAITADVTANKGGRDRDIAGGCMHEEIARVFPELAGLIRWHLVSNDGPMHYEANTVFHAGDRDHYGLKAGEVRPMRTGSGRPWWELVALNADGVKISTTPTGDTYRALTHVPLFILDKDAHDETPPTTPRLLWVQKTRTGEGKTRELDHARSSACWPEATDEELSAEPEVLRAALRARLPKLLEDFRGDMRRIGFLWTPEEAQEPIRV